MKQPTLLFHFIFLVCVGQFFVRGREILTNTPVIGVLGVPTTEGCVTLGDADERERLNSLLHTSTNGSVLSCFNSYYVKWIEAAGAQVVPVPYNLTESQVEELFMKLNGILFTGGGLSLTLNASYVRTAKAFYTLATSNSSDYFPVWGTCMGFQLLNILTAWNDSVLCEYCFHGVENTPLALNFTRAAEGSRFFGSLPSNILYILGHYNVTQNFHHDGVTPVTFLENKNLHQFYNMLSTNHDSNGKEFVSTIEAFEWPVYGTQWHPERPQFEWTPQDNINHTSSAILAMQYVADFFVNEARKSPHKFPASELTKEVIYNYYPINMNYGNQVYIF